MSDLPPKPPGGLPPPPSGSAGSAGRPGNAGHSGNAGHTDRPGSAGRTGRPETADADQGAVEGPYDGSLRTSDGAESDPQASRPTLPTADHVAQPLDPRIKPVWIIGGLLNVLQLTAVAALLDFLIPLPVEFGRITLGVAGLGTLLALITPFIRYRRWRYALRPHDLWIRQGLLTVQVSVIPYRRLQFVDTRSGPIERMFGLRQLVVHTAALGTSGRLPGLDAAHAERLRETLAELEPEDALV